MDRRGIVAAAVALGLISFGAGALTVHLVDSGSQSAVEQSEQGVAHIAPANGFEGYDHSGKQRDNQVERALVQLIKHPEQDKSGEKPTFVSINNAAKKLPDKQHSEKWLNIW